MRAAACGAARQLLMLVLHGAHVSALRHPMLAPSGFALGFLCLHAASTASSGLTRASTTTVGHATSDARWYTMPAPRRHVTISQNIRLFSQAPFVLTRCT